MIGAVTGSWFWYMRAWSLTIRCRFSSSVMAFGSSWEQALSTMIEVMAVSANLVFCLAISNPLRMSKLFGLVTPLRIQALCSSMQLRGKAARGSGLPGGLGLGRALGHMGGVGGKQRRVAQ
ncbi:hypothetical protein D3C86_1647630 [compost metagenome]